MDSELISASTSVIISLSVILFLLILFSFFAGKIKGLFKFKKEDENSQILVKAKYSIGVQQHLIVVETNGECFLLSVCKGGVHLISRLSQND